MIQGAIGYIIYLTRKQLISASEEDSNDSLLHRSITLHGIQIQTTTTTGDDTTRSEQQLI